MYRKGSALHRRRSFTRRSVFCGELKISFIWWGIGLAAGLLFAAALGREARQTLGQYVQSGMEALTEPRADYFDYFLKRTYAYIRLFLLIWILTFWSRAALGIKIVLGGKGFLQGYAQSAWIFACGVRGILLGAAALCPHNLLLILWITGIGCLVSWLRTVEKRTRLVIEGGLTFLSAVSVAAVEAYVTPLLIRAAG